MFGFEIMPAPFVVAHLQVGLTLQLLEVSLTDGHIPYLFGGGLGGRSPSTALASSSPMR